MMSDTVWTAIGWVEWYREKYPEVYGPYATEIALALGAMETLAERLERDVVEALADEPPARSDMPRHPEN